MDQRSDFELMLGAAMRHGKVTFEQKRPGFYGVRVVLKTSTLRNEVLVEREGPKLRALLREVLEALTPPVTR